MLMAPKPRVTGKRRKAPDHFRSKLGLAYFDSTINRVVTREGNEDTQHTGTDVTLYLPQMKYAQRPGTKTEKGSLGHVPREPAFKKLIPVTLAFPAPSPRKETGKMHNSVHSTRSLSC